MCSWHRRSRVWARAAERQNTADNWELPGLSVFWRTDYLDLAPLGRDLPDLGVVTTRLVRADPERDLSVLADHIEACAKQYFVECEAVLRRVRWAVPRCCPNLLLQPVADQDRRVLGLSRVADHELPTVVGSYPAASETSSCVP